jgi:hypothetical protein
MSGTRAVDKGDQQPGARLGPRKVSRFILGMILLGSLVAPPKHAMANIFTIAEFDRFDDIMPRMRAIGNDIAAFIVNPPPVSISAAVRTQQCMIELSGNLDGPKPNSIWSLPW